jgi:hypothetical protein
MKTLKERMGGLPCDVLNCVHEEDKFHFFGGVQVKVIQILQHIT